MNNIEHNSSFKETIRVFILVGDSDQYTTRAYKTKDKDGKEIYRGFFYDIWRIIKAKLDYKYNFVETYSLPTDSNFNEFVNQTNQGKYDIVIGGFFGLEEREKKINYTHALVLNANSILHKYDKDKLSILKKLLNVSGILVFYMLVTGILIGIILWLFDNSRAIYLNQIQNSINKQKAKFIRSLMTGVAAVYGEMGYLAENASLSTFSTFLIIFLMTVSFILVMFTQGEFTNVLLKGEETGTFNSDNLSKKPFLGLKGNAETIKLKRYGAKVEEFDDITSEALVKKYLNNQDKYSGVILSYISCFGFSKKYSGLIISSNFGYEPASYIVNPSKEEFLKDVNLIILQSRKDLIIKNLCNKYYPDTDTFVCSYT
tara:strand:+ start:1101 stop:2216 length:1116 start_codon:yes stop_codon:yes gene_type:complete